MLKGIAKIFKITVGFIAIMASSCICAETIPVPIEIQCSSDFMESSWMTIGGISGVQYVLETKGLRDSEVGRDIVEVNAGLVSRTVVLQII
jgi:hypothetical protein